MESIETLLKEIENLKSRNKKVEANKAWETSYTRKLWVAILTYSVILIFFIIIKIDNPYVGAIVPTLWFILSTFSLDFLKKIWISKFYSKQ
ncbi:MAG: hypothetical protein ACD_3C00142G0027 [uncultured bacterium (gcode 4)]|uniref:2TM domain-containing protein n=1 Tax=uncultured bacterium (gcode 4) TaxID=1234023 RepID=K2F9R4_9BACT|nr:MAG: hypothetical protein ACD_3C00142G0027 [uncultured bacterium (gcode 4)]